MGARSPSTTTPQPCPLSQLGHSAPRPRRTDGPKRASGSCTVQRESLLGPPTTAPTRLGSGKQRKVFSPPALCSPEGTAGRGCPWLPGPCCFAGGLRRPNSTPHGFSFVGNAGLGARKASAPRPQPCPLSQLGRSVLRTRGSYGPKRASGSCILQRETLLGQPTTASTCLGTGNQHKLFSPPALRSP